jgi:antitoxin ParD1/3/4
MNVSLTPKLEGFVKAKVKTGDYNNASEVIREAVRLLQERDEDRKAELAAVRRSIREGENSGAPVPWDPESIKEQARKKVKQKT